MNKITRYIALALAICALLTVYACKPKENNMDVTDTPSTQTAATQETTPKEPKALVMATSADFPPYEFYQDNKIVGIDADIARAIAERLGMVLVIEDMDFNSVIASVEVGKYDMGMAGLTTSDERKEQVSFTASYATGIQVIIVPENSDITSVDDLFEENAHHKIGVQLSTTGDIYTTTDLEEAGLAFIDRYQKGADAIMALTSGKVDCVVIDNEPAKAFVSQNPGLKILETEYAVEEYAIIVNKSNTELLENIDAALRDMIADGTAQAIVDKYIKVD